MVTSRDTCDTLAAKATISSWKEALNSSSCNDIPRERYLSLVVRDGVEARCGEWLLLASRSGKQFVACVREMAEVARYVLNTQNSVNRKTAPTIKPEWELQLRNLRYSSLNSCWIPLFRINQTILNTKTVARNPSMQNYHVLRIGSFSLSFLSFRFCIERKLRNV